jgi:transcriptional regulator with XRE-family HTH domain
MTQPPTPDWSTRLALSVAQEVRRHRQAQGLSAQQLADRCAEVGMPIKRSVLANMESGRRTTVTIAEILILAAALNIPPALLVFPVGQTERVEKLPGVEVEPLDAADWLGGVAPMKSRRPFPDNTLIFYRRHRTLVSRLRRLLRERELAHAHYVMGGDSLEDARRASQAARARWARAEEELASLRAQLESGVPDDATRERALEAEEGTHEATTAYRHAQMVVAELEMRARNLDSAEHAIRERAIDLEKLRAEIQKAGLVLPRLRDDLYGIVADLPSGDAVEEPTDDLDDFEEE